MRKNNVSTYIQNKVVFTDHPKAIAQFLHTATTNIRIAMCWFSNPLLFSILLKKVKAGIRVSLIVQFDQANFHAKGLFFHQLIELGGQVQVFHHQQLLHHKFAVVDAKVVLTGSYNWTRTRHADNILILENPEIANSYLTEFARLWSCTEPLGLHRTPQPPAPAFHQLFQPILWNSYDLRYAIIKGAKVWLSIFKENEVEIWQKCLKMQRHFLRSKIDFFEKNKSIWDASIFSNWVAQIGMTERRILKNYCLRMRRNDVLIAVQENGKLLGAGLVGSEPQASHFDNYCFARYVQWFEFSERTPVMKDLPKRKFGIFRGSGLRWVSYLAE